MKNNKKDKITTLWKHPPVFLKTTLTYFIFLSILALCVFILIYRYVNKINDHQEFVCPNLTPTRAAEVAPVPVPGPESSPTPETTPAPASILLQNEISAQNNRIAEIEAKLNQWQSIPQLSLQLLAMEILQEVLEGHLPLNTFVLYLQKTPEPWTAPILNSLSTIPGSKTYAELQSSLVLSQEPVTSWQRVKSTIKSFVRVRKIDERGHYVEGHLDDIHSALRNHNIQQALEDFGKLPAEEQAQLSAWKQMAQNRLTLETIKQKILLDLAGS